MSTCLYSRMVWTDFGAHQVCGKKLFCVLSLRYSDLQRLPEGSRENRLCLTTQQ